MQINKLIHKIGFVFRIRSYLKVSGAIRKIGFSLLGMKVGKTTLLPQIVITWPHQVLIGEHCKLEKRIQFKYDGIWEMGPSIIIGDHVFIGTNCEFNISNGITVGKYSRIASGCRFIDHDHGKAPDQLIKSQIGEAAVIKLGNDVWIGCNAVVLKGVEIGDGAIVGAGSVVTKSIPTNEIWAGVPAKKIGHRK